MANHEMHFFENPSPACDECLFLSRVESCTSPAVVCMYRSVDGVPSIRIGDILENLGIELPKRWRDRCLPGRIGYYV